MTVMEGANIKPILRDIPSYLGRLDEWGLHIHLHVHIWMDGWMDEWMGGWVDGKYD